MAMHSPKSLPTVQTALSALLAALGFNAMAKEVLTETENERLARYARLVIRQSPPAISAKLAVNFRALGLIA